MAPHMNIIRKLGLQAAAEAKITKLRRDNPQELDRIHQYLDRADYPWASPEENQIFWRVYRELVREPFVREKVEAEKKQAEKSGNGNAGYVGSS